MRTLGASDRGRRKTRSDKGKRRKTYRKKPTKKKRKVNGRIRVYEPKRKDGEPLKFYFWDIQKISLEGLHHWHRNVRRYAHRNVYGKNRLRVDIYPEDFDTKEKIQTFCEEYLWEGSWLILMWTHRTNKYHCSPRAVASVKIKMTSEGLVARTNLSYKGRSIKRYKFFKS